MRRFILVTLIASGLVACAGSGGPSATPPPTATITTETVPPAASSSTTAAASPVMTPIPGCLPECVTGKLTRPGNLPGGDYTTKNFFGGQFTVTVPDGWTSFEDSTGEFGLAPQGAEDRGLLFWIDVYPIVDGTGVAVPGFDGTAQAMVEWFEANPNISVIEKGSGNIGSLKSTTLEFGRSAKAVNVDSECPEEFQPCVGMLSFPQWGGGFYSQGGPFHERLVAVDAIWGGQSHAIYAMIEAGDEEIFRAFAPVAAEIIEGAQLPLGVGQ